MVATLQILIVLLLVIAAVGVIARRLDVPPSILLVLTGVTLALVPGLPTVRLAPPLVLLLVLPPIVYAAAVAMSWKEFRFNLRAISLLAVGCVVFTTAAVAGVAHWLLGLPWAVGFVLGAIVSPPDAVAPLSIARRLQLPRRILVVLEGEGLANDATALILYRFAIAAVSAGAFSLSSAVGTFSAIVVGEVAWGIGVGWLMLRVRRWVGEPQIEILLSLLTPYFAFWPPEHLGGSGVLATVAAGLYVSWNGASFISAATRLQGIFFWQVLIYLIDGLVFLITGLQARSLSGEVSTQALAELARSAALVCTAVILARFVWIFPATYVPRWLIPALARKDPAPPWQWTAAVAFTGVRGVVSLAAALAIPLQTQVGEAFPARDLILFLTFAVILVTLVGQGLLLPPVMRALGLAHAGRREQRSERAQERAARRQGILAAQEHLLALAQQHRLSGEVMRALRAQQRARLHHFETGPDQANGVHEHGARHDAVELALIAAERARINQLYRDGDLKDEARRRIEHELDLREASLESHQHEEA